jgi:hypothetical membrane protein
MKALPKRDLITMNHEPRTASGWSSNGALAGVLLLLAGSIFLMGVSTAEALYPDVYTTHDNEISDLGATRPPDSIVRQPSATIFNSVMIASGSCVLAAAWILHGVFRIKRITLSMAALGVGMAGVGVFPGNVEGLHPLFALTAFLSAGLAALLSTHIQVPPFRYVSFALGLIVLLALVVGVAGENTVVFDELGDGGVERWIAYPAVLWIISFGGYLTALPRRA